MGDSNMGISSMKEDVLAQSFKTIRSFFCINGVGGPNLGPCLIFDFVNSLHSSCCIFNVVMFVSWLLHLSKKAIFQAFK